VELALGDPAPNGRLDREQLRIVLEYDDQRFVGHGTSGWFEDELLAIQSQLPEGVYIKACINCLYSDYNPYGHGLFGCMMCFRNLKAEYLKVTTKKEFWSATSVRSLSRRFGNADRWNSIVERDTQLADLLWWSLDESDALKFLSQIVEQDGTVRNTEFTYKRSGATKMQGVVIPGPAEEWLAVRERVSV
jgi:hypothetical protein